MQIKRSNSKLRDNKRYERVLLHKKQYRPLLTAVH